MGEFMADDAVNALIPVAAVVHIALGVMALILVRRSLEKEWNERFAGYLISWMMIVLGLKYAFATIIDLKIEDFTGQDFIEGAYTEIYYSSYKYSEMAMDSIFLCLAFTLPLVYPYPILQKNNALKITTAFIIILGVITIPLDIFTEFANRDIKSTINWLCYVIWVPIYLRFLIGEIKYAEERAREVSSVALLLLLGLKVQFMIFWLQNITGLSKVYVSRWIVEDEVFFNTFSDKEIEEELNNFISLILKNKNKKRYLSKNNLHFKRINFLRKKYVKSLFLIPFRDPLQQSYSLLNQHKIFTNLHSKNDFLRRYMNYFGHNEFGANHKSWNVINKYRDFSNINYWLEQWLLFYKNIFSELKHEYNCSFICYENLDQRKYIEEISIKAKISYEKSFYFNCKKRSPVKDYDEELYDESFKLYEKMKLSV